VKLTFVPPTASPVTVETSPKFVEELEDTTLDLNSYDLQSLSLLTFPLPEVDTLSDSYEVIMSCPEYVEFDNTTNLVTVNLTAFTKPQNFSMGIKLVADGVETKYTWNF